MAAPELNTRLNTLWILDSAGCILSTREPGSRSGPIFGLVRNETGCAWAVRADVPHDLANELGRLASQEPPAPDLHKPPVFADRYLLLVESRTSPGDEHPARLHLYAGPAFTFPDDLIQPAGVEVVEDEGLLEKNFRGWVPGEIAAGRSPVMAIFKDGFPVSVCFCARRSDLAAEAGLETAEAYRGRGLGPRAAAAWALAIRASGRIPLYSTSWTNTASLAVARKLGLAAYACDWNLSD